MKKFFITFISVISIISVFSLNVFAATEYPSSLPPIPEEYQGLYTTIFVEADLDNTTNALLTDTSCKIEIYGTSIIRIRAVNNTESAIRVVHFELSDGSWALDTDISLSAGSNGTGYSLLNGTEILYSDLDVYDSDGNVFFQGAPTQAEILQEIVRTELTDNLNPKVVGAMTTLTVCGVGLIASLVVLNLFGKKSLIYLKQ